jgi:Fur family ferric uptake transcriptional regulator
MRQTKAKIAIEHLIIQSEMALSHADIYTQLGDVCDRVTIYRILDRLVQENILHKIMTADGIVKYARCKSCVAKHDHNHIHFSCQRCNETTCLETVPAFNLPLNYQIMEVNFLVSGVCPQCL